MKSDIRQLTAARVICDDFIRVESPADPYVERLENEKDPQSRLILATCALRHDPGCIEALVYLAEHAKEPEYAVELLRKAVDAGQHLWGPVAFEYGDEMSWWGFSATRPYMRAIMALGETHCEVGNYAAARECFEHLLEMNPHDNQGARFRLEEVSSRIFRR